MSRLKISPDLFLAKTELDFFSDSIDKNGFRKNILENSVSFGLIKNLQDTTFPNGRVTRDTDTAGGEKTIKIAPVKGVDSVGRFIYSASTINQIVVPSGSWYWVKVRYAESIKEAGTVAISVDGTLTGSGTNFLSTLRGGNFPMRIKFLNSVLNIMEYDVLEVTSDTEAILSNPATNVGGFAEFASESGLTYGCVGSWTPGVAIDADNKYPFVKDSMIYELVLETVSNTKPTYVQGQEFFVARVKVSGSDLITQDKRTEFWNTKGSALVTDIDRTNNPLIGIESVVFPVLTSPGDKTLVTAAWGMRSTNFSVDTSQNILTISSGLGGKFKSVADFTNGNFNGWRVYFGSTGNYSIVVSSVTMSGAINLTLDTLNIDDLSSDGGSTLVAQTVLVVPNCDFVQFKCTSAPGDNTPSVNQVFTFPVANETGVMDLEVYKSTAVLYNIHYRTKSFKEFTDWTPIPTDTASGYYTEAAFNSQGVLTGSTRQTYTSHATNGFITLQPNPNSYSAVIDTIFNEDLIGVNEIETLSASTTYLLTVGTSKQYQVIRGTQSIGSDTIFTLSTALPCRDGSTFKVHFQCDSLSLGGNVIYFKQGSTILKQITQGDVYQMYNQDNGIIFSFIYDEAESRWVCSQNYDLGRPGEIVTIDGVISDLFDVSGGVNNARGKVRGLYGFALANHAGTVDSIAIPNLSGRFIIGAGGSFSVGATGGNETINLTEGQLPAHNHTASQGNHSHTASQPAHDHQTVANLASTSLDDAGVAERMVMGNNSNEPSGSLAARTGSATPSITVDPASAGAITIGNTGDGDDIDIMNPYYALIYAKKLF